MRLFGAIVFFGLLFVCSHGRASAFLCNQPYALANGGYVDANALNSNFQALVTCGNSLDNSQVGSLGFYASQIIPTSGSQATFGGTQTYTFPVGLNVTTNITASGHAVAYDIRYGNVPTYHVEAGTIMGLPANGTYNVSFLTTTVTVVEDCTFGVWSYGGSTPNGNPYLSVFTGAAPPLTGFTLKTTSTVYSSVSYHCDVY